MATLMQSILRCEIIFIAMQHQEAPCSRHRILRHPHGARSPDHLEPELFVLVASRLAAVPDGRPGLRGEGRPDRRPERAGGTAAALPILPGAAPDARGG